MGNDTSDERRNAEQERNDAGQPPQSDGRKPYASPSISRHGNLRLMTQLE